jgi:hypothetical protein
MSPLFSFVKGSLVLFNRILIVSRFLLFGARFTTNLPTLWTGEATNPTRPALPRTLSRNYGTTTGRVTLRIRANPRTRFPASVETLGGRSQNRTRTHLPCPLSHPAISRHVRSCRCLFLSVPLDNPFLTVGIHTAGGKECLTIESGIV